MKILGIVALVIVGLALGCAVGALLGVALAWGWSAAIAEPFGLPTVLWWQAWFALVLLGFVGRAFRGGPATVRVTR